MALSNLIPVVNKLHDVLSSVGSDVIDLPQIVVVGSQSSGKSSVLEGVVGRDFLPRGNGIVTRRPLVLQLLHREPREGDEYEEWGEFLHRKGEKFGDFAAIRAEIEAETERVVGTNKGISAHSINLVIYSPNVLNLTLVDLPGITKVPVGDQPTDIEKQIRKMILSFIEKPNTLILAVSAANQDIANSDALQLARLVDPDCERTLGVLTKLDLMDRGTHAMDVLNGEVIPLQLGFIGIVNRSQEDINNGMPISKAIEAEAEFFASHFSYRTIAHRMGTPHLARTLNSLLLAHIKSCLPALRSRIQSQIARTQHELAAIGAPIEDEATMRATILEIITKFSSDFKAAIDGSQSAISTSELSGGARISFIFHEVFFDAIERIDPCEGLTTEEIRTVILNSTGTRGALFIPEASFELLVKRAIARLKEPSIQCCNLVYEELLRLLNAYHSRELDRFHGLRDELHACVASVLQKCLKPTHSMVSNAIRQELAYINTRHPDFVRALPTEDEFSSYDQVDYPVEQRRSKHKEPQQQQAAPARRGGGFFSFFGGSRRTSNSHQYSLDETPDTLRPTTAPDAREQMETELIRRLLRSYFAIVKKTVQDQVPKATMCFLVNQATSHMQSELVKALYKDDRIAELLEEPEELAQLRLTAQETLNVMRAAEGILAEIRDFRATSKNTPYVVASEDDGGAGPSGLDDRMLASGVEDE